MRLEDFKNYCVGMGFKISGNNLTKSYPLPKTNPDDESEKQLSIALEYVIERPWVKGFRVDSIGRKTLISKAKLKNIEVGNDGALKGFMRRKIEGDKYTWIL